MRKGIAVSPGVAVGTAYCIHEIFVNPDTKRLEDSEVTAELAAYESARDRTAADLNALRLKVEGQVGHDEAAIFAVHEAILRDADFTDKVRAWIVDDRLTAAASLHKLLGHYTSLFSRTRDNFLKDRVDDVRDLIVRLSSHLSEVVKSDTDALEGPLIVVADELLPSQAVALGDTDVRGIVTQAGSQTSHAAIIARSRGIPAVSGINGILRKVTTGDTIIVDGREGVVIVSPDPEARSAYLKLEREYVHLRDALADNRDQPAETSDGVNIELLANINGASDATTATAMGSNGVGLFRTEYMYLTHPTVPDEDEQLETYQQIIDATPNSTITIRTLDIGGDKTVPYLGHQHQEANPFLGWRSIRLSFEHPDFFSTQIRAVLRASRYAEERGSAVRLLFPMITTLDECHRIRQFVRRAQQRLAKECKDYADVPIGMMLEVPAAAIAIDTILPVVDFVSVGSNDLVQYLMAADRDNPKVSHLCQPMAPAVLRLLTNVIRTCHAHSTPITVCGEMAGQPRTFVLLLGMGLRSFSMSPAFIPSIKGLASHITIAQARGILHHALELKTTTHVKRFMADQLKKISPEFAIFDTV
jgi:phosphoenolpyruvate-protein phosphotransferase (PTS system enzyme I)